MQRIKEFKASYENCKRLGPQNKENNTLWQLVSEVQGKCKGLTHYLFLNCRALIFKKNSFPAAKYKFSGFLCSAAPSILWRNKGMKSGSAAKQ